MQSILLIALAVLELGTPKQVGIDFFYFEGEEDVKEHIDVNFGLYGECRDRGISMFASEGVLLTAVRADGKVVAPRKYQGMRHGAGVTVIERPGPSFFYHMPLSSLESADPYDPAKPLSASGIAFVIPGLPHEIDIAYRLRCADGSLSSEHVTRGRRFARPRYLKGSGG
jgi:hypothetical protein